MVTLPSGTARRCPDDRRYARSGPSGKHCSSPSPGPSPDPDSAASSSGSPPWPSTSRSTPSPSRSLALDRPADWKALESFAEYGAWDAAAVTRSLTRLVEQAPGRIWHGYHVSAVDDTKVHRNSQDVWGTCTFHEYTARCPNRAATVRAHNWVVLGALLDNPGRPPGSCPICGRLYFRKSQLPTRSGAVGPKESFRTKCELAVALLREQAQIITGRHLGVFDGGYALKSVIRPLVLPEDGSPRIEFLTRLRHDARLFALPPEGPCQPEVGPPVAAAPPGRSVDEALARGDRLRLRSSAEGPLEGDRLPVVGLGT